MLDWSLLFLSGAIIIIKGLGDLRRALPVFVFLAIAMPPQAGIDLPGALPRLNVQRLTVIIILALYTLQTLKTNTWRFRDPLKHTIAISIAVLLISTGISLDPLGSAKQFLSLSIECYLIYFIVLHCIETDKEIEKLAFSITIAVGTTAIIGLLQVYTDFNLIEHLSRPPRSLGYTGSLAETGRLRAISVFPHPILFGAAMSFTAPIVAYVAIKDRKLLGWVVLGLMVLGLYKSMSRGPLLGLALSMLCFAMLSGAKARKAVALVAILGTLILIMRPGILETLGRFYFETVDENAALSSSYNYRFILLELAYKQVKTSNLLEVLFGSGLGTFCKLGLVYYEKEMSWAAVSCDSSWISFVFEIGLFGFGAMVILCYRIVIVFSRNLGTLEAHEKDLMAAILAGLVSYMFMMTNVALYGWGQLGHMFWIVVSLGMAVLKVRSKKMGGQNAAGTVEGAAERSQRRLLAQEMR